MAWPLRTVSPDTDTVAWQKWAAYSFCSFGSDIYGHIDHRDLASFEIGNSRLYSTLRTSKTESIIINADGSLLHFRVHLDGEATPWTAFSRYQKADPSNDIVHNAAHTAPVTISLVTLCSFRKTHYPR